MSKEMKDSWWDSGPVYIVFGLASLFILSTGIFEWPNTDLVTVVKAAGIGWKILGGFLYGAFATVFICMAIGKWNASVGLLVLCLLLLAGSLASFCGFWYGNY